MPGRSTRVHTSIEARMVSKQAVIVAATAVVVGVASCVDCVIEIWTQPRKLSGHLIEGKVLLHQIMLTWTRNTRMSLRVAIIQRALVVP